MTTRSEATQALEFVSSLQHPTSTVSESLRVSALANAITRKGADLLIEHLSDFLYARKPADQDRAARCLAAAMTDLVAAEVVEWDEFHDWQCDRSRPCESDYYHQKRDSAA